MSGGGAFHFEMRPEGVAVLLYDSPGSSVNLLGSRFFGEIRSWLERVKEDAAVRACVLGSAKPDDFAAGADLHELLRMHDAREGEAFSREAQALLELVATSAKPYVAAIHGAALGGGLEVALACAYRIASDHPKTQLGLPEVQLGLLPAGGGTQRLPRLIGLPRALPLLLTGRRLNAREARRCGLVDAVTSPGGLVDTAAAAAARLVRGELALPARRLAWWDRLAAWPMVRHAVLRSARRGVLERTRGFYPAPLCVLDAVAEGLARGARAGLAMEANLFGRLAASSDAKSLIRLFDAANELKKVPDGARGAVRKLAVLGAGLMGEGIASVSLHLAPVVLKDVDEAALARTARNVRSSLDSRLARRSITRLERDRRWQGLHLTTRAADVAGADLVVEAVFEDLALKHAVLAETEPLIADDAVFATNTSALPIAEVARAARRPERVLGMHYFSPVPKMPLLEIVVTRTTAEWAVAAAKAFGVAQGKTPIVVRDGPGFYTTRILAPYLNEAALLLSEGAGVLALDRALRGFGFLVGPAALVDEVGLDVAAHVVGELATFFGERGAKPSTGLAAMGAAGLKGRRTGRGFYLYPAGKRAGERPVNAEVYRFFGGEARRPIPARDLADRCVLLMVNEAIRCLGEDVISSPRDGDVGAVFGLGFPPFRGGPFLFVDGLGPSAVLARLSELEARHGSRFAPAPLLVEHAKGEKLFRR